MVLIKNKYSFIYLLFIIDTQNVNEPVRLIENIINNMKLTKTEIDENENIIQNMTYNKNKNIK